MSADGLFSLDKFEGLGWIVLVVLHGGDPQWCSSVLSGGIGGGSGGMLSSLLDEL